MILTGDEIKKEIARGNIRIEPFDNIHIQPNCYDFHLGNDFLLYEKEYIEPAVYSRKTLAETESILLEPGHLYLTTTREMVASSIYSQLLFGCHSIGSLGIWVHISAPLGHTGSSIRWTLEIRVIKKTICYPGMKMGKICFLKNDGEITGYGSEQFVQSGKYLTNNVTSSLLTQDSPE